MKAGLTLVEVIISLVIFLVVVSVGLPLLGGWPFKVESSSANAQLIQTVRLAREQSIAGLNNQSHGVYFDNTGYTLFQGVSYASRQAEYDLRTPMDNSLGLTWQLTGSGTGSANEIVFDKNGLPSRSGKIIVNNQTGDNSGVDINQLGIGKFASNYCLPDCRYKCNGDDDGCGETCTTACSWQTLGQTSLSDGPVYNGLDIIFNPLTGQPYVSYSDNNNSNKITVKYYNGSTWTNFGNPGFTPGGAYTDTLAFNPATNQLYVAFADVASSTRATVMYYNNTNWVTVGQRGFSVGQPFSLALAFNPNNNQPCLGFGDGGDYGKARLMCYNGSAWTAFGTTGFSAGSATYLSLAFNPVNKRPYVAYRDGGNANKITVMYHNGSVWTTLGNPGFSDEAVYIGLGLAFNPDTAQPYVTYSGVTDPRKAVVKYYDNVLGWTTLGTNKFSAGSSSGNKIVFNPITKEPYVVFQDFTASYRTTVMRYHNSAWSIVGVAGFPGSGTVSQASLVFNPITKEPCVVFMNSSLGYNASAMCYGP